MKAIALVALIGIVALPAAAKGRRPPDGDQAFLEELLRRGGMNPSEREERQADIVVEPSPAAPARRPVAETEQDARYLAARAGHLAHKVERLGVAALEPLTEPQATEILSAWGDVGRLHLELLRARVATEVSAEAPDEEAARGAEELLSAARRVEEETRRLELAAEVAQEPLRKLGSQAWVWASQLVSDARDAHEEAEKLLRAARELAEKARP